MSKKLPTGLKTGSKQLKLEKLLTPTSSGKSTPRSRSPSLDKPPAKKTTIAAKQRRRSPNTQRCQTGFSSFSS